MYAFEYDMTMSFKQAHKKTSCYPKSTRSPAVTDVIIGF